MAPVSKQKYVRWLLVTLLLLSAGRVVGFAVLFGRESLQLDFSAFYTAGQAVAQGASPYRNHLARTPPIWDGFGLLRHSRFLYPPLAARLFQPLSHLPYRVAKGLWTGLALVCIALAMWVAHGTLRPRMGRDAAIGAGICVCLFHPLLTLLERGQVDGVTLLSLVGFVSFMQRGKRRQIASGLCLALATLLKLHCVYFAPFLILRKKWIALVGFTGGCLFFGLCSLALDGHSANRDYVLTHLPRISQYGEGGTREMLLPRAAVEPHLADLQDGMTQKGGHRYRLSAFEFVGSATLVDVIAPRWGSPFGVSLVLMGLFLLAMIAWHLRDKRFFDRLNQTAEWTYWQLVATAILLTSPITWAMNTVWLLPTLPILIRAYREGIAHPSALYLGTLGLLLAGIPDPYGFPLITPYLNGYFEYKYAIAESAISISAVLLLRSSQKTKRRGEEMVSHRVS